MMTSKVSEQTFTYEQAKEFLTNYWYWNPQELSCFEEKYYEVARFEHRLPNNPKEYYDKQNYFFAFSSLFGEQFFTLDELTEFCILEYQKCPDDCKPKALSSFYMQLRDIEPRLHSAPKQTYDLTSMRVLFGLKEVVYFQYQDARSYCIREYENLPKNKKPKKLTLFYKKLSTKEPMLPSSPNRKYNGKGWVSYRELFGLQNIVHMSYEGAVEYCSMEYYKVIEKEKPTSLTSFYRFLRKKNCNLPSSPNNFYRDEGWVSFNALFGLDEKILFSYEETVEFCSKKYAEFRYKDRPSNLTQFYYKLRAVENRLPRVPSQVYSARGNVLFKDLFMVEEVVHFSYSEAVVYCSLAYDKSPVPDTYKNLLRLYRKLRADEPRLPVNPKKFYASSDWESFQRFFGIKKYFSYEETLNYCKSKYWELDRNKLPINLCKFYKELRKSEPRLPSCPSTFYEGVGPAGFKSIFGLG